MTEKILLDHRRLQITLNRLCKQLIENHGDFTNTVIIGVQPRGITLASRMAALLRKMNHPCPFYGKLDVAFYRDDFRREDKLLLVSESALDFSIEGRRVILIDDVMYTGRTIRAALDALLDYGRPLQVELLTLVERRFSRHLPIQPDYIGISVDSIKSQEVRVEWAGENEEDKIVLVEKRKNV